MKQKILMIPLAVLGIASSALGQSIGPSTLNAMGGNGTLATNEYEWSVGQMTLVGTYSSSAIVVTQGVLQPSTPTTAVPNTLLVSDLKVFPNPSSSLVNIQYGGDLPGELTCRVLDMAGRVVIPSGTPQAPNALQVNVTSLACASYMLEVTVTRTGNAPQTVSYKISKLQ